MRNKGKRKKENTEEKLEMERTWVRGEKRTIEKDNSVEKKKEREEKGR